jgi:hypothetical protein
MTINGLPAHPLLVHTVLALLPLAAVAVVLHTVWPAARRRLGIVTPLLALAALVTVPITSRAGEDLARSLGGGGPLVERHERLADQILPWAVALAVAALAQWALGRLAPAGALSLAVRVPVGVVTVAVAIVATVVLVRAGDAGAQATWSGVAGAGG